MLFGCHREANALFNSQPHDKMAVSYVLPDSLYAFYSCKGSPSSGASSPWLQNFLFFLLFVGRQSGICFISPFLKPKMLRYFLDFSKICTPTHSKYCYFLVLSIFRSFMFFSIRFIIRKGDRIYGLYTINFCNLVCTFVITFFLGAFAKL
jgi:hypothetical protein